MFNKKHKIILINILIILIICGITEFISYKNFASKWEKLINMQTNFFENEEDAKKLLTIKYRKTVPFNYEKIRKNVTTKVYKGTKKGSIVTIGCSYTEGTGLEENQTFAYKLNQQTGRTTYNRGVAGTGAGLVYRQLSDKNFKNEVDNPEYIIYTFIYDHIYRQFHVFVSPYHGDLDVNYVIKNNRLKEIKPPLSPLYALFTIRNYLYYRNCQNGKKEERDGLPLFTKTMEESVKTLKTEFPDAKFVFINFPDTLPRTKDEPFYKLPKDYIKKLQKMGMIYIDAEELIGHEISSDYRLVDKDHPNEKVWDEIVPALIKRLDL